MATRAAEAVGRHIRMLCPTGEQEDEVARILARVASGERIDHFETTATAQGRRGDRRVGHDLPDPRSADGEVAGASTVARDITERKRAADALAEAEERFRGAFEEAPIGMVMLDRQLRVLRVNDAMCRLLGRDAESWWAGRSSSSRMPTTSQPSVEWIESRSAGDVLPPLVKRYVRPDGSIVEAQVTTALVEPDELASPTSSPSSRM